MYLSDGLVEGRDAITPDDLERLRTAELEPAELERLVGALVDRIVRSEGTRRLEVDLIQALLLLQRRDPALSRRIVRFLRGESLNQYDRQLLGGLGARDKAEDSLRTIRQLATLMHELQLAALVIVVDQVEDAVADGRTVTRLQQALDAMRAIADAIPSSVVVISCLQDVYDAVKPKLSQALLDRLGRDEVRLTSQRQPDEIEQMLTEVPVLQFWISRLLVELSRLGRKRPSQTLQAAAFFDEADAYVPATSSPPTKEPMFDLLRRSRSTGIGVLLATQNPGDFDYKARDNISTWLLGKIAQNTAIEKMRNLIGNYPDVGPRLASQRTGSFFLLTGTTKRELKADRSLMETVQLPETEVAELARQTRAATSAQRPRAGA